MTTTTPSSTADETEPTPDAPTSFSQRAAGAAARAKSVGTAPVRLVKVAGEQFHLVTLGWDRHQRTSGRLVHFHVDHDTSNPIKPGMEDAYERARAQRNKEDETLEGMVNTAVTYGPPIGLAAWDLAALAGHAGSVWPIPVALSCFYVSYWWRRLCREGRKEKQQREGVAAAPNGTSEDVASAAEALAASADHSAESLTTTFRDAGVLTDRDDPLRLAEPVQNTDDGGWRARIIMPKTVPASRAAKAKERIVVALGSDLLLQQVWLTVESPRILVLRVFAKLPFSGDPVEHPYLDGGELRIRKHGIPVGYDLNGNTVWIDVENGLHGLVVAASNMGKTVHVVNLVRSVIAASDAEIGGIFDGKSSGDYDPVRAAVGWYLDMEEGGPGWWERLADYLESELVETRRRQQRARRGETLNLRFVILDEFHFAFGGPGDLGKYPAKQGEEAMLKPAQRVRDAIEELSRVGRSAGVRVILASQSFDGNILPTHIANNILWRLVGHHWSTAMKPADTLGEVAKTYQLSTEQLFTPRQRGAVVAIAPNHDTYAICRGWYQPPEAMQVSVDEALGRGATAGEAAPDTSTEGADITTAEPSEKGEGAPEPGDEEPGQPELPRLLRCLENYLAELADTGDDRDVIPGGELYREAGPEGLSQTAFGRAVTEFGIPNRQQHPVTGSTLRNPGRAVADIREAIARARGGAAASPQTVETPAATVD